MRSCNSSSLTTMRPMSRLRHEVKLARSTVSRPPVRRTTASARELGRARDRPRATSSTRVDLGPRRRRRAEPAAHGALGERRAAARRASAGAGRVVAGHAATAELVEVLGFCTEDVGLAGEDRDEVAAGDLLEQRQHVAADPHATDQNPWGLYVTCPVTLAGRGPSSNPVVSEKIWIASKQARIFFKEVNSYFWCRARAEDVWGNVYYGDNNHTNGNLGNQSLNLVNNEHDWGGMLEPNEGLYIEQLDIECRIGSGSAADPAKIYGYDIASCQSQQQCTTVRSDNSGPQLFVQGSGIECSPGTSTAATYLQRSELGMKNVGASTQAAYCPITQTADDSYEHSRQVQFVKLFYTGVAPTCRLEGIRADGTLVNSSNFVYKSLPDRLELPAGLTTGLEKSLAIKCDVPPGSVVEGYVVGMSGTRNSAGI